MVGRNYMLITSRSLRVKLTLLTLSWTSRSALCTKTGNLSTSISPTDVFSSSSSLKTKQIISCERAPSLINHRILRNTPHLCRTSKQKLINQYGELALKRIASINSNLLASIKHNSLLHNHYRNTCTTYNSPFFFKKRLTLENQFPKLCYNDCAIFINLQTIMSLKLALTQHNKY